MIWICAQALEGGQFQVDPQPQVHIATRTVAASKHSCAGSARNGAVVARRHFIPVREENGLSFGEASGAAAGLADAASGPEHPRRRDPFAAQFVTDFTGETFPEALAHPAWIRPDWSWRLRRRRCWLTPRPSGAVQQIHDLGVGIALDDFGHRIFFVELIFPLSVQQGQIDRHLSWTLGGSWGAIPSLPRLSAFASALA